MRKPLKKSTNLNGSFLSVIGFLFRIVLLIFSQCFFWEQQQG